MCIRRYALGGFGLVFVEATAVEEVGLINEHDLGIWNDAQVQSFKPLIAFMKVRRRRSAFSSPTVGASRPRSGRWTQWARSPRRKIEPAPKCGSLWVPPASRSANGWLTPHQLTTEECRAMVRTWLPRPGVPSRRDSM